MVYIIYMCVHIAPTCMCIYICTYTYILYIIHIMYNAQCVVYHVSCIVCVVQCVTWIYVYFFPYRPYSKPV